MRVGLLRCGQVRRELTARFGDYPELFGSLLSRHDVEIVPYDVVTAPPPATDGCDGWIVSGSSASTFEGLGWIGPVEEFVRTALNADTPVVGICFGHQLVAQALGGKVVRSPGGWEAGVHRYDLTGAAATTIGDGAPTSVRLVASHQDQVVAVPKGATVLARSEHCEVGAFTVGSALAIQPHPEYPVELSRAVTEGRRRLLGPAVAEAALASLNQVPDRDQVGRWMAAFLHRRCRLTTGAGTAA